MGDTLETDVCVVGAGPAGLVLAAELVGHGIEVLVLESGSAAREPDVQELNDGTVSGDPYAGLSATRRRGVGGTAGLWNTSVDGEIAAKYVPLDAIDLEPRPSVDGSGWPFDLRHLLPFYRRSLAWCGLRRTSFDGCDRAASGRVPLDVPLLAPRVYRVAPRAALLDSTLGALRGGASPVGRLRTDATVLRLELSPGGARVVAATAAAFDGTRTRILARRFVLAGGAIENARLLLASDPGGVGIGNRSGRVGRCFMEHPRDVSLRLLPASPDLFRRAGFYDLHRAEDGSWILGRLGLRRETLRELDLPNASGTLLPRVAGGVLRARRALGPLGRLAPLRNLLPAGGHGWSSHPLPGRVFDDFTLLLNLEQSPHPQNRVLLDSKRDRFGIPTAELRWRWRAEDRARLERLRRFLAEALEASGLVRVVVDPAAEVDPNAHHHAGTTRMAADPERGVVDPDLRVHGVENLYVAGASTFPTAGFANPLLTIAALSVRLADHLAGVTGAPEPPAEQ